MGKRLYLKKPCTWRLKKCTESPIRILRLTILFFHSQASSVPKRWVQLAKVIPWDEIEKEYAFM